jgi:cation diffusion facilitator CzcD-associated flavoprotein CzcO
MTAPAVRPADPPSETDLLIIGAGPFGMALAAQVRHLGIEHTIVGEPMGFWKRNMPAGMFLRSACDWHLDPLEIHTIEEFARRQGKTPADVEPLSLEFYLAYARWFQEQKGIEPVAAVVRRLDRENGERPGFRAVFEDGRSTQARRVAVAVGFRYFQDVPAELSERLPARRFSHTCDLVDFRGMKGKRCLILGGRQSAFEWTALLHEAGAASVDVSYRHPTPAFAAADWSWVTPLVDATVEDPAWYRRQSPEEKLAAGRRLWSEGRLKLEPWLERRVLKPTIRLWPETKVDRSEERSAGDLAVRLDNGETLIVDHVILATGYRVRIERVPFLAQGNILASLETRDGSPVLDESFQTNVPGLFITSMAAAQDFGPYWGFTISVRVSAKLIGRALVG